MKEKISCGLCKMENILTGKKGYNIYENDDMEKQDGFITPEGKWYSCDPVYHSEFAFDYVGMFKKHLQKTNKKVLQMFTTQIKKYTTEKDFLVDYCGWMSVTVILTDAYVQPSRQGITYAQKKTLKQWYMKFKNPFRIRGDLVNDEFHDFFSEG